jgi:hypothetical protein
MIDPEGKHAEFLARNKEWKAKIEAQLDQVRKARESIQCDRCQDTHEIAIADGEDYGVPWRKFGPCPDCSGGEEPDAEH